MNTLKILEIVIQTLENNETSCHFEKKSTYLEQKYVDENEPYIQKLSFQSQFRTLHFQGSFLNK